jgi:hypothetical protein
MATTSTVTATLSSDIAYLFVDSVGRSITETASLGYSLSLAAGTGTGQINAAVMWTGFLPSGGTTNINFTGFPKPILGGEYPVKFTDVKGVIVENQWNGTGGVGAAFDITSSNHIADMSIAAPANSGFTGLFNGALTETRIRPGCTWIYNDRFGVAPDGGYELLSLIDTDGSGVPVSVIAVGVTG